MTQPQTQSQTPAVKIDFDRSPCPIATTLDMVGDKWSMVILRDMFVGKSKYGEFLASPEGIPTNILADRLKRLAEAGLIEKSPYQDRPVRHAYKLTTMGAAFLPVLQEISKWGNRFVADTWVPPSAFMKKRVRN